MKKKPIDMKKPNGIKTMKTYNWKFYGQSLEAFNKF